MKKGIIVGLIALTLLVGALFVANISASEPDPELKFVGCNLSFADTIYVKYAVKGNDLSGVKLLIWTEPQSDYSYGSQSYVLNSIGTETVSPDFPSILLTVIVGCSTAYTVEKLTESTRRIANTAG